jgi:hypothetical protein
VPRAPFFFVAQGLARDLGDQVCHYSLGTDRTERPHFVTDLLASGGVSARRAAPPRPSRSRIAQYQVQGWIVSEPIPSDEASSSLAFLGGAHSHLPDIHTPFQRDPRFNAEPPAMLDRNAVYSFAWYA